MSSTPDPPWIREGIVQPHHRGHRARALVPGAARVRSRLGGRQSAIALTFDDGPRPPVTDEVLRVLATHGVAATFFVLVDQAEEHPSLVRDIVSSGHALGLHGDRHESLAAITTDECARRLRQARARLQDLAQIDISMHRPPFGHTSLAHLRAARLAGLEVVLWSHDPRDWDTASRFDLDARLRRCLLPGAIVLLHDGVETGRPGAFETPAALDRVLANADDGLRFAPLAQVVGAES